MTALRSPCHFACLVTLVIAVSYESDWAGGAVIAQSSSEGNACVACTGLAIDPPVSGILNCAARSSVESATTATIGGEDSAGIAPRLLQLANASVTGRSVSIDLSQPVEPFLDGPSKPT